MIKTRLFFLLFILNGVACFAQPGNPIFGLTGSTLFDLDLRPISVMDLEVVEGNSNITFNLTPSNEAGIVFNSNLVAVSDKIWLNYSCANPNVGSRHIDISISSGTLLDGFELRLDVGSASGVGGGIRGTPNPSTIVVNAIDKSIVSGIQSAFTGNGALNGHQLSFSLYYITADFGQIVHTAGNTVTLTYTLVDD